MNFIKRCSMFVDFTESLLTSPEEHLNGWKMHFWGVRLGWLTTETTRKGVIH